MNKVLQILRRIHSFQIICARSFSVGHHSVMCTHYTCKKTEADDSCAVFMFKTFIIYKRNVSFYNCLQHFLIVRLQFFCVGKEKICLSFKKHINGYFFYTEQNITGRNIFLYIYAGRFIFFICKATGIAVLHDYTHIMPVLPEPFALCRRKRHTGICGDLPFSYQSYFYHACCLEAAIYHRF